MKPTVIPIVLLPLLAGCGTARHLAGVTSSDSAFVRVVEHVEYVPVRVAVPLPAISETVSTRDTSSHLENAYAVSDATVGRDGVLTHTLETKPQTLAAEAEVRVEYRDSIVYRDRSVEKTVEVKVEKELNWWQKMRMDIGGAAICLALLAAVWLVGRTLLK